MAIILNWSNPNSISIIEDEIRLYRATSAFDENNLPAVLAVLPAGATRYVDQSAIDGQLYFYRVAIVKSGSLILSDFHQVRAPSDGKAVSGTPFEFADCPKYFIQDFSKTPLFDSGHADSIRGNNHSTRKLLAAMVVIDEKLDVLDTEYVTITSDDLVAVGEEWLSGLIAGDQITWESLLKIMLVPSKSDVAATCNRILGEHIRNKYKIGKNNDQAFGYFMTQAGLRSGCVDMLAFSNSLGFPSASHDFNSAGSKTLFTARSMATVIGYVYARYPRLVEILKSTSISVEVKRGENTINLSFPTIPLNQHGGSGGYEIGKTGDAGELGHEMFVFSAPSGDKICGVALDNPSRISRWANVSSFMLSLPNLKPEYRSAEIATDPNSSSLTFRVQGDSLTDISPNRKTVAAVGNASIQDSLFFKDKAIHLPSASGVLIGDGAEIGLSDFTLEVYFRKTDGLNINSTAELIGQWTRVANGRSWAIQLLSGNEICFWYSLDGSDSYSIATNIPSSMLIKKMPIHITVQRKSGVLALFINGVMMVSENVNLNFYSTLSNILVGCRATTIGGTTYENHLSGVELHEASMKIGIAEYDMSGFTPIYRWCRWD